jgi:pimeloyl-ACP methyl ester carboxylesterase
MIAPDSPAPSYIHTGKNPTSANQRHPPLDPGLVYVAAFAPDCGESIETLFKNPTPALALAFQAPGAPVSPILPPQDGFLALDRSKFATSFAADVKPGLGAFMADSQVPWGVQAFSGMVSEPAWKSKPSWYLVSTDDKMIPPDAQRAMSKRARSTVVEVKGSHAAYVSQLQATLRNQRTSVKTKGEQLWHS